MLVICCSAAVSASKSRPMASKPGKIVSIVNGPIIASAARVLVTSNVARRGYAVAPVCAADSGAGEVTRSR